MIKVNNIYDYYRARTVYHTIYHILLRKLVSVHLFGKFDNSFSFPEYDQNLSSMSFRYFNSFAKTSRKTFSIKEFLELYRASSFNYYSFYYGKFGDLKPDEVGNILNKVRDFLSKEREKYNSIRKHDSHIRPSSYYQDLTSLDEVLGFVKLDEKGVEAFMIKNNQLVEDSISLLLTFQPNEADDGYIERIVMDLALTILIDHLGLEL